MRQMEAEGENIKESDAKYTHPFLGLYVHLHPCVFAAGEGAEPVTTQHKWTEKHWFSLHFSLLCGTEIRISVYTICFQICRS